MIWQSIGLMTALDLLMIGMGVTFMVVFGRHLNRARTKGFFGVAVGLSGFGLFYVADLFTMWVLPYVTSPQYAMAMMEKLHLNYHWGIMLIGIACMLWGFNDVGRALSDEITERRSAEEALRENRERFELASEGANEGMWDWPEMSQDRQWWSPRWYELLGYADQEVEASHTNFKAFLHPDDRGSLARSLTLHLEERVPFEAEYRLRTKSGDYRWFRGHGQSRLDQSGTAVRMSGSIRDVTEQRRTEERQRTLDARLFEIEKLESLGVFARGFAHDFNNLLTSVMGNASFALVTLQPASPLRSHMEAIEQSASHGAELAKQLLAYAGEGRGLQELMSMSEFVESAAPLLAANVPDRVVLDYSLRRGLPPIAADPAQIRQILVNLVTNAAHAIGAIDGVITVSTGTVRVSDSDVVEDRFGQAPLSGICTYIEVSDTGTGIDEDTAAKMWDPFFSTRTTGRGLGLAVVQGVVRSHGGRIRVQSRVGAGTAVRIIFSAAQAERPGAGGRLVREAEGTGADAVMAHPG